MTIKFTKQVMVLASTECNPTCSTNYYTEDYNQDATAIYAVLDVPMFVQNTWLVNETWASKGDYNSKHEVNPVIHPTLQDWVNQFLSA